MRGEQQRPLSRSFQDRPGYVIAAAADTLTSARAAEAGLRSPRATIVP